MVLQLLLCAGDRTLTPPPHAARAGSTASAPSGLSCVPAGSTLELRKALVEPISLVTSQRWAPAWKYRNLLSWARQKKKKHTGMTAVGRQRGRRQELLVVSVQL